jgi:tight adherence protein B
MRLFFVLSVLGIAAGVLLIADSFRSKPTSFAKPNISLPSDAQARCLRALIGAVAFGVLTGWVMGVAAGAALGWWLTELIGGGSSREAEIVRTEAIASWTEMLRDTLSGAHGLEETIIASADVAPKAIRREVVTFASHLEHESIDVALRRFADDLEHPIGDLVVSALLLAATGSTRQLGDLLGTLAEAARDECAMRLRVEAARARMRTAVRVITGCTLLTALGLVLFNQAYLEVYDEPLGQAVLGLIALSWGLSLRWLSRMSAFVVPERFLVGTGKTAS